MKSSVFKRLSLALVAVMVVATAQADIYFKINDIQLRENDLGTEIIVPVWAKCTTQTDIWDINLTFPEGLTPIEVTKSYGMEMGFYNSNGQFDVYEAQLLTNEDYTHMIGCTLGSLDYYKTQNDEGETVYEPCGSLRWEVYGWSDYYEQLLLIKFYVDPSFTGGEIQITASSSCGYNARFGSFYFSQDTAIDPYQADINGDGVINIDDATCLLNHLIGLDSNISGGDVHHDGNIDILDYEEMKDYLIFGEWYTGHRFYTTQTNTSVEVYYPPVNEPTEASFYINDRELTVDDLGTEIIIPVGAHFGNYISSWDVEFIFPEGLTPVYATRGSDMTMNFYDDEGQETTKVANLMYNNAYTHFVSMPTYMGYQAPEIEGDLYEPYGTIKWDAGDYDEMFLIHCEVSPYFTGGSIEVITNASSGYDTRNDLMVFEPITNEVYIEEYVYCPGDINSDGQISISDVTEFAYYLIDPASLSDYINIQSADADRNGVLNIADLDGLCDYLLNGQWYAGYALSQGQTDATITVYFPDYTGDVNGDGQITISDVTSLIDMLLTMEYIEYNEFIDVNGDGYISIADVTALIDKLLSQQ
ncbi:MAG: dockerin type I repeat-containing protein [Muribaculaceae bacterium]|nr:dockerin type I repeat-containing protein [Muribaculaceae bacterium]